MLIFYTILRKMLKNFGCPSESFLCPRPGNFIPKFFANPHENFFEVLNYRLIFVFSVLLLNLTALLEIIIIICYYIYIRKERRKEMVNTLELRGIETYSPEIQTFLREIEKSFLQVLNNCVPADQQEKEAIQLRDTVEGIGN